MSVPDPNYIALYQLQQLIIEDSTGLAAAGAQVYFYQDSSRNTLKTIYELQGNYSSGYTFAPLANPVTLGASGTFVDGSGTDIVVYVVPFLQTGTSPITYNFAVVDLYYVKVVAADGSTILDRGAVPANVQSAGATPSVLGNAISTNEVANPQFVEVNFLPAQSPGLTVSVTGSNTVTSIIPDWDIITTGTGTVNVIQLPVAGPIPGTSPYSNPPYSLQLISSGISQMILQQTFAASPTLLWGGYVNISFNAYLASGGSATITAWYQPSNGGAQAYSQAFTITGSGYGAYQKTWTITGTENSDTAPTGNVKLQFFMPTGVTIQITSVQLCSVPQSGSVPIYLQESTARQQDHLFHYWQPWLNFKPIPSLLTGWDFFTNPYQFGTSGSVTTTAAYIFDQTIACSAGGNFTWALGAANQIPKFTAGSNNSAFYLLQYLQGADAYELYQSITNGMSVNLAFSGLSGAGYGVNVYLYSAPSTATLPTMPTTIVTMTGAGIVSLTAGAVSNGWTAVTSANFSSATATLSSSSIVAGQDIGFSNYRLNSSQVTDCKNFAIVVAFFTTTSTASVAIDSIALVPGVIPTRPAPLPASLVLKACQYYYESLPLQTFNAGTFSTSPYRLYIPQFGIDYQMKRTNSPVIAFASIVPTAANISMLDYVGGNQYGTTLDVAISGNFTQTYLSNSSAYYTPATTTYWATGSAGDNQTYGVFSATIDARLGKVT